VFPLSAHLAENILTWLISNSNSVNKVGHNCRFTIDHPNNYRSITMADWAHIIGEQKSGALLGAGVNS
jgi:hypothetical protein